MKNFLKKSILICMMMVPLITMADVNNTIAVTNINVVDEDSLTFDVVATNISSDVIKISSYKLNLEINFFECCGGTLKVGYVTGTADSGLPLVQKTPKVQISEFTRQITITGTEVKRISAASLKSGNGTTLGTFYIKCSSAFAMYPEFKWQDVNFNCWINSNTSGTAQNIALGSRLLIIGTANGHVVVNLQDADAAIGLSIDSLRSAKVSQASSILSINSSVSSLNTIKPKYKAMYTGVLYSANDTALTFYLGLDSFNLSRTQIAITHNALVPGVYHVGITTPIIYSYAVIKLPQGSLVGDNGILYMTPAAAAPLTVGMGNLKIITADTEYNNSFGIINSSAYMIVVEIDLY